MGTAANSSSGRGARRTANTYRDEWQATAVTNSRSIVGGSNQNVAARHDRLRVQKDDGRKRLDPQNGDGSKEQRDPYFVARQHEKYKYAWRSR